MDVIEIYNKVLNALLEAIDIDKRRNEYPRRAMRVFPNSWANCHITGKVVVHWDVGHVFAVECWSNSRQGTGFIKKIREKPINEKDKFGLVSKEVEATIFLHCFCLLDL